jgi:hypothetical protein
MKGKTSIWYTGRPPKMWNAGDTLFIWAGSPILKVIGCARLSDPDVPSDGELYNFRVEYLTNRIDGPTIEHLRKDEVLGTASFLKSGPSGTVFRLTSEQGLRMLHILAGMMTSAADRSSKRKPTKAEEAELEDRLGSGFGSAEQNKTVEMAAIKAAKKHYKGDGWNVQSVEAQKIGFDLLCRKGKLELHVGTAGVGAGFILTGGEYRTAESDERYELCLVESALSNPKRNIITGKEMFERFEFVELAYKVAPRAGKGHQGK